MRLLVTRVPRVCGIRWPLDCAEDAFPELSRSPPPPDASTETEALTEFNWDPKGLRTEDWDSRICCWGIEKLNGMLKRLLRRENIENRLGAEFSA